MSVYLVYHNFKYILAAEMLLSTTFFLECTHLHDSHVTYKFLNSLMLHFLSQ